MKCVLTIAGSDSSGGAGIQADLKTMAAHGVYGMSAITALTAQNTQGVTAVQNVTPEFLAAELDAIFEDIPPHAVKIGMVSAKELLTVIREKLLFYHAQNIVLDPVMVATSGARLIDEAAVSALQGLFPIARLLTPNIAELEVLTERAPHTISTPLDLKQAAAELSKRAGAPVLAKGGHLTETADDVLAEGDAITVFSGARVDAANTHGTGCTLSSAIASNLAKDMPLPAAIRAAKEYLTGALRYGLNLGQGSGPLHHGYDLKSKFLQ